MIKILYRIKRFANRCILLLRILHWVPTFGGWSRSSRVCNTPAGTLCMSAWPAEISSVVLMDWRIQSESYSVSQTAVHAHSKAQRRHLLCLTCFTNYLSQCRPLIPVSKLTVSESYENYMSRSYQVTKDILSDCKNSGKRHTAELLQMWNV